MGDLLNHFNCNKTEESLHSLVFSLVLPAAIYSKNLGVVKRKANVIAIDKANAINPLHST